MKDRTALQHVNRMGQVYYLQEGKTPTGKPKYYTGRKLTGKPLDTLPDGAACQHIEALEVLAEVGKDSLMESYLWTIHRYHREHEPPGG